MSKYTNVLEDEITRLKGELHDIKTERAKRTTTLATLYPELIGEEFTCWMVGGIDWMRLHDKAEAIRRARAARMDKAWLKEWEAGR